MLSAGEAPFFQELDTQVGWRGGQAFTLDDEIVLRCFRLQKMTQGSIDLFDGEADPLKGPADVGTARSHRLALAFLSPKIQSAVAAGTQPPELTLETIVRADVPLDWTDQEKRFGFAS